MELKILCVSPSSDSWISGCCGTTAVFETGASTILNPVDRGILNAVDIRKSDWTRYLS